MALTPLERWRIIKAGGNPDAPPPESAGPAYKKPGEVCLHPKNRRAVEFGSVVGRVEICLDCGRIMDDKDLKEE
jgi:hypothetical protein